MAFELKAQFVQTHEVVVRAESEEEAISKMQAFLQSISIGDDDLHDVLLEGYDGVEAFRIFSGTSLDYAEGLHELATPMDDYCGVCGLPQSMWQKVPVCPAKD
jgi:hypothetical protein